MFETRRKSRRINLTALVDVVFLLLIFFMLTTNFTRNTAIELDVPNKVGLSNDSWKGAIIVRPNNKNQVQLNAELVPISRLEPALRHLITASPNKKVIVKPYNNVALETVVKVMDMAKVNGASSLSLIK
jgi:biopolymer transport protein ExbD